MTQATVTTAVSGATILRARGLTMAFGGAPVLKDVDVELRRGEIHGLIGENGAGKSTIAKLLAGVHRPVAGEIEIEGETVEVTDPHRAIELGVALIHQEPLTFPDLSVAENIFIGRQPCGATRSLAWGAMRRQARAILDELGAQLAPETRLRGLSIADQQMVEMAAALSQNAQILLMDETTASLTPSEARTLFAIMRRLRERGAAIVFIGHRMEEIFEICDRVTILRDGEKVAERMIADTNVDEVLRLMVGREVDALYQHPASHEVGEPRLAVEGLCGERFRDISFKVHAGEIVGLAGLVGAGRTEVAQAIFGAERFASGSVRLDGEPVRFTSPRVALAAGLAYVPEDRQHHGVLMPMSLTQNTTMSVLSRISPFGWLRPRRERALTEDYIRRFAVRHRTPTQPIRELSGGNQQKLVLSKALLTEPRVLILDEPTRGIDIGAKVEVHRLISELAAQGMAILMISSDLPEVLAMSDRILVMREGHLAGELSRAEASAERVIAAAAGQ